MASGTAAEPVKFPSILTGPRHSVGCVDLMHCHLLIRLFYPAIDDTSDKQRHCRWLPRKEYATGFVDAVQSLASSMPEPLPSAEELMVPSLNALLNAPVKTHKVDSLHLRVKYPIAVFSHGLAGNRCLYSATSIGLASHGYIVANVEHRDESASTSLHRVLVTNSSEPSGQEYVDQWIPFNKNCANGRFETNVALRRKQVKIRRQDVSEALDLLQALNKGFPVDNMTQEDFDFSQFIDCLDTDSCFVIGHSFGGATTIHTLFEDKRFKCGIALDPNMIPVHEEVYNEGIDQPLLFINSELGYQWKANINNINRLLKPTTDQGVTYTPVVTLRGATHFGFTDYPHAIPGYGNQPLEVKLHLKLVLELTVDFLERFLHQTKASLTVLTKDMENGASKDSIILGSVNSDLT